MSKYEDLLNELVILEKKYLLYSHGHDFVNQAVLDLLRTIGDIHSINPNIKIVDTGYSILINDVEFNLDNLKVEYLMQLLGGRGIYSLTFCAGIGFSSIMDFFYLINSIPANSKLLYHDHIQLAIHNIDLIKVEEMDYGKLKYFYKDEMQEVLGEDNKIRLQLYESVKTLNPDIDSNNTNEMIDIALNELSKMPQNKVQDFLQGLSDDVVSKIIERVSAKRNSISPSLIDLLVAMDSARKLAGDEIIENSFEEISYDQVNKLVEREAYELYVTEDYRQHLRSLLEYDNQSVDNIAEVDMFNKILVNRTITTALINLTNDKLDKTVYVSFVDIIHKYLEELIICMDWQFIQSITNEQLVSTYLKQDSTIQILSKTIRDNESYSNNSLMEVIKVSGPKNLSWLMDSYIEEMDSKNRRGILRLIQSFQEAAAIQAVRRFIGDPTKKLSLFMPIIRDHLGLIPKDLASKLFSCDSIDAKLLAMRILLIHDDDNVKNDIERLIKDGDNSLVLDLLDLIRDFKITEVIDSLVNKIGTLYIDESMFNFIVKTIETISCIDSEAYKDLKNTLMKKRFTLSPKNLRGIKKYLEGVSHDHKFR